MVWFWHGVWDTVEAENDDSPYPLLSVGVRVPCMTVLNRCWPPQMEINGTLVGLPQHWQSWFKLKLAEVMGPGNASVIICLLKQVLQGMLAVFAKSRSKVLVFSYSTRVSACLLLLSEGECLFSLTQHGWVPVFSNSMRVSACLLLLNKGECLSSLTQWGWVLVLSYSTRVSACLLLPNEDECSSSLTWWG